MKKRRKRKRCSLEVIKGAKSRENRMLVIPGTILLIIRTGVIQPQLSPGVLHYFQLHNMP